MRSSRQFSFLDGPSKLVFVRIEESTFTGLVGPLYPYCLLVAFCAFLYFLCFIVHTQKHKQKLTKKTKRN